jgi:hypothetical protein
LGLNIFFSPLFANTPSLCSSLNVRDRFTPIHNRRQNYSFVYFNVYVFRQQTRGQKVLDCMVQEIHEHQLNFNSCLEVF